MFKVNNKETRTKPMAGKLSILFRSNIEHMS